MSKKNPIIDWELATQLAGNKRELAKEMLNILSKTLPNDIACIKQCENNKNYDELQKRVHKLHGALCYCGVPRLKQAAAKLETALKNSASAKIRSLFEAFEDEANQFLKEAI